MAKLDVNIILERYKLDFKKVAAELYPHTKFPELALKRIVKGEALLDSEQIAKLAALADVQIQALFEPVWSVRGREGEVINFEAEGYRAVLNLETWETSVFKDNSLFHTEVLSHKTVDIKEYFKTLDRIVANEDLG